MCVCGPSMQHNCICWMCSICMFTSQTCPPSCYQLYLSIFILYLYISVVVFISSLGQCNTIVSGYAPSACLHPRHARPPPTIPTYHLSYLDVCIFLWLYLYLHMANATQLYLDMLNLHVYIQDMLPLFPLFVHFFFIFLIFYGWYFRFMF